MKNPNHNTPEQRRYSGFGWRAALDFLALPAMRVHNYRNLHKSMFYDAVCELDCNK